MRFDPLEAIVSLIDRGPRRARLVRTAGVFLLVGCAMLEATALLNFAVRGELITLGTRKAIIVLLVLGIGMVGLCRWALVAACGALGWLCVQAAVPLSGAHGVANQLVGGLYVLPFIAIFLGACHLTSSCWHDATWTGEFR